MQSNLQTKESALKILDSDKTPRYTPTPAKTASLGKASLRLLIHWILQLTIRGFLYGAAYGLVFFIIGAIFGCVIGLIAGAVAGLMNGVIFALLYVLPGRAKNRGDSFLLAVACIAPLLTFATSAYVLNRMLHAGTLWPGQGDDYLTTIIPSFIAALAAWQSARKMGDWQFERP